MPTVTPNTITRFSLSELSSATLEGSPEKAMLSYASDGTSEETDGTIKAKACPDLVTVTWEIAGVAVKAFVDVVAARYCSIDDIRQYHAAENQLSDTSDEAVWEERQRAEELIEAEAHRIFQPVLRTGTVDRPNCSTSSVPFLDFAEPYDIRKVVMATRSDGSYADVSASGGVSLIVSGLRKGEMASIVVECGMQATPAEVKGAVVALAAYHLLPKVAPDNAISTSTDAGVIRFVVGGVNDAATSVPEVNAVIQRYGNRGTRIG
ncbi:MAG: hypothetical protein SO057_07375 [Atopobiaceae bacterium]|nr:hypothetical protein [Atopobiaceae bacterium]